MESNLAVLLQWQLTKWTIWMASIHKKSESALTCSTRNICYGFKGYLYWGCNGTLHLLISYDYYLIS